MATNTPMLDVSELVVHYGGICALDHVSLRVDQGEIVSVIGANGAGKSTLLRSICAVKTFTSGTINFKGNLLKKDPSHVVPEGRRIFGPLSVHENLMLGAYTRNDKKEIAETMDEIFKLFPRLQERLYQRGGTLSGGEQQMLAVGRALMFEQNATLALEMCDRAYVLETGKIRMEGRGADLLHDERVMESYLGITK
jgi:branched-chain amino acid transport system ATP-binding protein